jgi:hypothetical protein
MNLLIDYLFPKFKEFESGACSSLSPLSDDLLFLSIVKSKD